MLDGTMDTNIEVKNDTELHFSKEAFDEASTTRTLKNIRKCLAESLKTKYNITDKEKIDYMLEQHGLDMGSFDFVKKIENIISGRLNSTINDAIIDDNSNKNETIIPGIMRDVESVVDKAVGYDYLYRIMKEMYGKKESKRIMGDVYDYSLGVADSTKLLIPYCYAIDASKLVLFGRDRGQLQSSPSKRVSSYISALCETLHEMSNHVAGAIAIGTFFMDIAHLMIYKQNISLHKIKSDKKLRKEIKNEFQQFVHSVNSLSRNAIESPFTNLSIFDKEKLASMISEENMGWYFAPTTKTEKWIFSFEKQISKEYVIDYIMELQKLFLEFFDKGDPLSDGKPYRFPVVTINFSKTLNKDGKYKIDDSKYLDYVSKLDTIKYNLFASEGTKVASCCFHKDQKVLVRNSKRKEFVTTFKDFITKTPNNSNTKIFHNGFWKEFEKVKIQTNDKLLKITTTNNKEVIVTKDHIFPTIEGDKFSSNLTTNDYLMFNTRASDKTQKYESLSYEQGYLVGAFLGDGSYMNNQRLLFRVYRGITLSLNAGCVDEIKKNVDVALKHWGINKESVVYKQKNNVYSLVVHSTELASILLGYVPHNVAHKKYFNEVVYGQSQDFRNGILDGWYATDGGNSNRHYTTSEKLVYAMETLCVTLGKQTMINVVDRTDEEVIIRGEKYNRNHKLYCLRIYAQTHKSKDINYMWHNNSIFFKIKDIVEIDNSDDSVYCVNIKNDAPYFTLANGIITHNCRLISNEEMMSLGSQSNSFGGSAISLGSHRVVVTNFVRLALEASSYADFKNKLFNRQIDSAKILKAHKELIKKLTEKGLQPYISSGMINMNRLFSTFGIMGVYEASEILKARFAKEIKDFEDITKDFLIFYNDNVAALSKEYSIIGNIEQIPGESFAVRLAKADKVIYGEKIIQHDMYANQFIPLWKDATIFERLAVDGKYNQLLTGGGIVHAMVGERLTQKQIKKIVNYAVEVGCEHFAINPIFSVCPDGHTTIGRHVKCPKCGIDVKDYYTRVVGFFTPVSSWNNTRRNWEFNKRTFVDL